MRTVQDHLSMVLKAVRPVEPLEVSLSDAAGCILAQDIEVIADVPALPLASIDGYAVLSEDIRDASTLSPKRLSVVADLTPVDRSPIHIEPGQCALVASGSLMPFEADTVVPFVYTDRGLNSVSIPTPLNSGSGVKPAGWDIAAGQAALTAGMRLNARRLALAAGLGMSSLPVFPAPRVVIMPIGDELIVPGGRGAGVFDANGPGLKSAIQDLAAVAIQVAPGSDHPRELMRAIEDQMLWADLVITTGGLSMSDHDTLQQVVSSLGTVAFDQVAMQPGRMHGVGVLHPGTRNMENYDNPVPVICLPGNPVAAVVGFELFVRPALRSMAGYSDIFRPSVLADVKTTWVSPKGIRQFVPAFLSRNPQGRFEVEAIGDPLHLGQPALSWLAGANALAVVPEEQTQVAPGGQVHCLVLED